MVNVDELIQDPNKPGMNGRKTRAEPMVNFFGQPGIQTNKLGTYLKTVAENMIKGNQDGWTFASTTTAFSNNVFGIREKRCCQKRIKR